MMAVWEGEGGKLVRDDMGVEEEKKKRKRGRKAELGKGRSN